MTNEPIHRQPSGTGAGGEFAEHEHDEAEVTLSFAGASPEMKTENTPREALATLLRGFAYGQHYDLPALPAEDEYDRGLRDNYLADADDLLAIMPHLVPNPDFPPADYDEPKVKIARDAERGRRFVEMYGNLTGSGEDSLSDLLADLMHYQDSIAPEVKPEGENLEDELTFDEAFASARNNYEAEKREAS